MNKVGFMQGRLSPVINGMIQAFPWNTWEDEFRIANKININLMEWTLDFDNLYKNPLMYDDGRKRIQHLSDIFKIKINSLTGDCFMQYPFWKSEEAEFKKLTKVFKDVSKACALMGIEFVIVPLVDNGSLKSNVEEKKIINFFFEEQEFFQEIGVKVIFESDFNPQRLKNFISHFNNDIYGINYDIGNSAALGFNVIDEMECYGDRILNIHVKDRPYDGTTVPLGQGDANFDLIFKLFKEIGYKGNYILQTARVSQDHDKLIKKYHNMVKNWMS